MTTIIYLNEGEQEIKRVQSDVIPRKDEYLDFTYCKSNLNPDDVQTFKVKSVQHIVGQDAVNITIGK